MKAIIVFRSKYGTTKKCAELIAEELKCDIDFLNLKSNRSVDIKEYDIVLIGSSIYASKIHNSVIKFIDNNKQELKNKKIGLYVCCKEEDEKALEYIKNNFPEWIVKKALVKAHLGHEINLEKMSFLNKVIVKTVAKVDRSYSDIKTENIENFISSINRLDGVNFF